MLSACVVMVFDEGMLKWRRCNWLGDPVLCIIHRKHAAELSVNERGVIYLPHPLHYLGGAQ